MKLIIITQKVNINDDNLGFFHRWLEKLIGKGVEVKAICLSKGEHHLPKNATVFSLGKEKGYSKLRQFFRLQKFLWQNIRQVDGVLVHMCPIYAVLSFPLVKIFRKRFVMFYAHGGTHIKLKIAEKLLDTILTSSSSGCRLKSKKIKIIGQGIDVELFNSVGRLPSGTFRIMYAGRINKTKDPKVILRAADILINQRNIKNLKIRIVGHPLVKPEREYLEGLKKMVEEKNLAEYVEFIDGVPYAKMPDYYRNTDLFINPSSTGSLDKVVLEAMASGCFVLNCNEGYRTILNEKYMFGKGDKDDLVKKIINLMKEPEDSNLRDIVVRNHNLSNFIDRVISAFNEQ